MKSRYEEYKALREQGKTYREIADAFGITKDAVADYCQSHGLGYSEAERTNVAKLCSHPKGFDYWQDKINLKYNNEFELISLSETNERHERLLTLKCYKCGAEKKISSITLRTSYSSGCESCKRKAENVERQIKNLQDHLIAEKILTKKRLENEQIGFRFCECGAILTSRGRFCDECREKRKRNYTYKYSYKKCKEIWYRAEKKRTERLKNQKRDYDLTNKKLFERDKGICHLCGGLCDWNDGKWKNGVFYAGGNYPSRDHLIPVSKDGSDTWDNVKLAHKSCNERRGAKKVDEWLANNPPILVGNCAS